MVESALEHARILQDFGFEDIAFSLKSSNVPMTIEAYRLISQKTDYPLHLGVTEAGTIFTASVKSAAGIGCLLAEGIGDTIRVSITGDPEEEVRVGIEILKTLGLRKAGVEIISCPTCGRTRINLIELASEIESETLLKASIPHLASIAMRTMPTTSMPVTLASVSLIPARISLRLTGTTFLMPTDFAFRISEPRNRQ